MLVLGLESSCDETAAAIVDEAGKIHANIVLSQLEEHAPYGGVVPEIAARAHLQNMDSLVAQAMEQANIDFPDLDVVAATCGPGLIGGVLVGAMTGKSIAAFHDLPFVAVNHLEGHALSARLDPGAEFPYLLLLVSGGHCQLLEVRGVGDYTLLGSTIDDALGEAFDKTAKLLGLGYPGGPALEAAARQHLDDPNWQDPFTLPRPMKGRAGCDFSFSGLKTAVRQAAEGMEEDQKSHLGASFHHSVADVLIDRAKRALQMCRSLPTALIVAGGVAANSYLRAKLETFAKENDLSFKAPPRHLCTDNAAMIAWAGLERFRKGHRNDLDFAPRPRWPLNEI